MDFISFIIYGNRIKTYYHLEVKSDLKSYFLLMPITTSHSES